MKKRSFQRHSFERVSLLSPNIRSIGIIVLALVLLVGLVRLVAPGAFIAIASPFWGIGSGFTNGIGAFVDSFGNTRMLTEERDRLIEENAALSLRLGEAEAALADYGKLGASEGLYVGVLARPPVASYDVLILGAGRASGITERQIVYGNGGVPIGTIRDVTDTTARAVLFSEAGRETQGWAGDERIAVTFRGKGSGIFGMTVSKDAGLHTGTEVYLPGPGAIPVGIISRITTDPSSPDAEVFIFPYANPFSLSSVRVGPALLP